MKTTSWGGYAIVDLQNVYEGQRIILRTLAKLQTKVVHKQFLYFVNCELSERINLTHRIEGLLRVLNKENKVIRDDGIQVLEREMDLSLQVSDPDIASILIIYGAMTTHVSKLLKSCVSSLNSKFPEYRTILLRCVLEEKAMEKKLQAFEDANNLLAPLDDLLTEEVID